MLARSRKFLAELGLGIIVAALVFATSAWATTITWSHTFVDGETLTAGMLETMKTDITSVVNAGGGPVGITNSQTISGDKVLSGTNVYSGSSTFSGAVTLTSTLTGSGAVIQGATPLVFEGATDDAFETSFAIADPTTPDKVVTFADQNFTTLGIGNSGDVIQVVNTNVVTSTTGTTAIPYDDTIPQKTEGDQYMSLAITPTNTSNLLRIEIVWVGANSGANRQIVALFQDATANALAGTVFQSPATNGMMTIGFSYYMTAGTTSATTFAVRSGSDAGATTTFNGASGGRILGGVTTSSITITEIRV